MLIPIIIIEISTTIVVLRPNISNVFLLSDAFDNTPLTRCCTGNTKNIMAKILKNDLIFIPPNNYNFVADSKIVLTSLIASSTLSISFFAIETLTESMTFLTHFAMNSGGKFLYTFSTS